MIIAFSGNRCVGKDTAYKLFAQHVCSVSSIEARHGIVNCVRFAFADTLKSDLKDLIKIQFGIDIFNPTKEEKEFIRPMMITYGCMWREKDPEHWVKIVIKQIQKDLITPYFAIVDLRFENELDELEKAFGKDLIHVNISNKYAPPPTVEEEKHYRKIAQRAHYYIDWGNNTLDEQKAIILNLYTRLQSK
jgi:hypothetical protein